MRTPEHGLRPMHLLAAQPGGIADGSEAVDLGQTPGEVVILSAAESELVCLMRAQNRLMRHFGDKTPSLRLASLLQLGHNMSVDLYADSVLAHAGCAVIRLLGGRGYWPYGVEQTRNAVLKGGGTVVFLPGDDQPDGELQALSSVDETTYQALWRYFTEGGVDNAEGVLTSLYRILRPGMGFDPLPAKPLLKAGLYWPDLPTPGLEMVQAKWAEPQRPRIGVVFYRALLQAGNLAVIDALIAALRDQGLNPVPLYVSSLKEPVSAGFLTGTLTRAKCQCVLNATGFAVNAPGAGASQTPFDGLDIPVIQTVFSGGSVADWKSGPRGLGSRDIAMNIALPEVDGRIIGRAVSFKGSGGADPLTAFDPVIYLPQKDRIRFTAELAARWVRLRETPADKRRVAFIMANYPNKDARLGNGVGLDTPAGLIEIFKALQQQGYTLGNAPETGAGLITALLNGPTNQRDTLSERRIRYVFDIESYNRFFAALPEAVKRAVADRWGPPEQDPFFIDAKNGFALALLRYGNIWVGLQPARGYNINPSESYHSPDLVPPHHYFAFYAYLRSEADAHAIVHMGKHGNMEWLPGKSLALSETCFPEAVFGPMPHLYPFIVNDPGEGTQAKRRAQAVIIDHLTPPLTRAESYGPLKELEQLVDEYFEAATLDPRRLPPLRRGILSLSAAIGLDRECAIAAGETTESALAKLDAYLCELKERQIRDGLHIFGKAPQGQQLTDLLVALARLPRANADSLHRAIAADLKLNFDPLNAEMAAPWTGPKPACLRRLSPAPWRSAGDTVERIEWLAERLVAGDRDPPGQASRAALADVEASLRPKITRCGQGELAGLLAGLNGCFVPPGPSGAPTRGRPDVLPTGRNFYSVDTRSIPTQTAWELGWKSATLLVERHVQDTGDWPRAVVLTAWGTSNMRTGGDDIAQALALMGVRPKWEAGRVTGFDILPSGVLGRPRVDVTLRISGFFRDAFPNLIDLIDSAARAVAGLDEPWDQNPMAENVAKDRAVLIESGLDAEQAARQAGGRVFGSKPGAYGAGLQALIDEKAWQHTSDLAEAYLIWGCYGYGAGAEGVPARQRFETRLRAVDAVIHNQDNHEHDVLDSDDYYQFEGGIAAAVETLTGAPPVIYHGDHARPENPRIRTLEEEIARVVRARAVNPKWIAGVRRHGYKGAFEMAATLDYLFAFAATTDCVSDHQFDAVFDAYLGDKEVRDWIKQVNPAALADMQDRFREAIERGLWTPRRNSTRAVFSETGSTT